MQSVPDTKYAVADDGVHIAYQVFGTGDVDLVLIPGFVSHLEFVWEFPPFAALARQLGSFARVIAFDKRGTGLSDAVTNLPDTDRRMLDVQAVMNAAGSDEAVLFGISEGAAMAITFAATYPEHVRALAIYGGYAMLLHRSDHPIGVTPELLEVVADHFRSNWGTGVGLGLWAPSLSDDEDNRRSFARFQRLAAGPSAAHEAIASLARVDVHAALPLVDVPTVVFHRVGDRMVPIEVAHEVARGIEGARMIELPGNDHLPGVGDMQPIYDELSTLLTGSRGAGEPDRVLATVLFTDIVDSTSQAAVTGDAAWRSTLDAHDRFVERHVAGHGGRVVKNTGDGALAVFDGPTRAIRCAAAITSGADEVRVAVRAGLHTGEVVRRGDDLSGIAVHLAARVAAQAKGGEVLVSRTLVDLVVGSGLAFEDRGEHELKGVDGSWRLFALDA